jgi:endonuclease YncB( thermonuclease family)
MPDRAVQRSVSIAVRCIPVARGNATPPDFTGRGVGIIDGDILEVLNGHHVERIRLSGIDCPEKGQAFG